MSTKVDIIEEVKAEENRLAERVRYSGESTDLLSFLIEIKILKVL